MLNWAQNNSDEKLYVRSYFGVDNNLIKSVDVFHNLTTNLFWGVVLNLVESRPLISILVRIFEATCFGVNQMI